ncbi:conserved hypothetical protein [Renibacterium salmoninarum ATCC 33209]|uniref:CsbD-like domain-containing protein n=1 Tax=Renibacterium salmoninarum (strain ATCC 33209 / DSM 20767 / JCM 11484 / NBRC 15589 / NCIMB 2235) TaxID=288705 RepID=A9WM83_RENSM|nr:CsbD family protein [Renibacterium salmoninarum]ABY22215.1 conserved hypothetical protein [Renibacterium salmoninarum ATCC 33209]
MGIEDKAENKLQDLAGNAKEAVGNVTDNNELKAEGKADQAEAGAKDAVENVKDFAADAGANLKAAGEKLLDGFKKKD